MDTMDSGDESEDEPMYTEMFKNTCDGNKSHPKVNGRDEC